MKNEEVVITINYKGQDVIAVVSLEEANILLNDEAAATEYAEKILTNQGTTSVPTPNVEVDEMQNPNHSQDKDQAEKVHLKKKTEMSKEATLEFLRLRKEFNPKFNDRKTVKNCLWEKIALEMRSNGYEMPGGREGAETCRQKFASLQRSYMNYIKQMKTTGSERRDPPPYLEEMNEILGGKLKVDPPHLEDSMDSSTSYHSSDSQHQEDAIPSCSNSNLSDKQKEIKNRFNSYHNSVRATTNFNKVLDLFKEQHKEIREDRKKYMSVFRHAINVQNEQRERFLAILEKSEKRKRKRSDSSSSDEL